MGRGYCEQKIDQIGKARLTVNVSINLTDMVKGE